MRTPQELLVEAERLLDRTEEWVYDYSGYHAEKVYRWSGAHRTAFATIAQSYIALANTLIQLEQANFMDDLVKGLDSYGFSR